MSKYVCQIITLGSDEYLDHSHAPQSEGREADGAVQRQACMHISSKQAFV